MIINDRHAEGDYYRKPTQFFFMNCEPEQNVVFEPVQSVKRLSINYLSKGNVIDSEYSKQVQRSLIHPQFAERFIKTYILTKAGGVWLSDLSEQ